MTVNYIIMTDEVTLKIHLWVTDPKGVELANYTSAIYWHIAVRRDIVISITLCQAFNINYLNKIRYLSIK